MARRESLHDFIMIKGKDLEMMSTKLETGYKEDWFEITYTDKEGVVKANFREADVKSDTNVKIDSQLAFRIWQMVEESDMKAIMLNEIEAREKFDHDYNDR